MTTTTLAPDVGSLVEYGRDGYDRGPGFFRVSGWLRIQPEAVTVGPMSIEDEIIAEILAEEGPRKPRLEWCLREEATHVSLSGICGAIAPIEKIKVTGGMVSWPESLLTEARESAIRRAQNRHMLPHFEMVGL